MGSSHRNGGGADCQRPRPEKGAMQSLLTGKHRLPGFSGEWAKMKLGNLCQISKGEQLGRLAMIEDGTIPVINGGTTASGYTDRANRAGNCITISEGGNSCGFVSMMDQPFWCGGHCYALKDLAADRSFLFASLKHREAEIMTLRVGSGLPNIQKKALCGFELNVPPLAEQDAIGRLADSQDGVLSQLQTQLTALHKEKSALMQQLLTGKRRVRVGDREFA
jgi:type I restriction enzyme, S subunit